MALLLELFLHTLILLKVTIYWLTDLNLALLPLSGLSSSGTAMAVRFDERRDS